MLGSELHDSAASAGTMKDVSTVMISRIQMDSRSNHERISPLSRCQTMRDLEKVSLIHRDQYNKPFKSYPATVFLTTLSIPSCIPRTPNSES